jgi:heat shock protein HspQ
MKKYLGKWIASRNSYFFILELSEDTGYRTAYMIKYLWENGEIDETYVSKDHFEEDYKDRQIHTPTTSNLCRNAIKGIYEKVSLR